MKRLAHDILCQLGAEIRTPAFLESYRSDGKWFTRSRMLAFSSCVLMILTRMTTSLRNEIGTFFENILGVSEFVTPQAFSKARRHIKEDAFVRLFEITREAVLRARAIRRFRGYRLFAIDGTDVQLPTDNDLHKRFPSANLSTPKSARARASFLCDVMAGFVLDATLEPEFIDERSMAEAHLDAYAGFAMRRDLLIMDRGYPSKKLLHRLSQLPGKFLLRVSESFQAAFDHFDSADYDSHIEYEGKTVYFRVVRIELSSGITETLVTNLSEYTMPPKALCELYAKRWGVETAFRNVKDRLSLIRFSGRSEQTVRQDFFACLTFFNIACAFCSQADQARLDDNADVELKYRYASNRSACFSFLKRHLATMLLFPRRASHLIASLFNLLNAALSPIRPGRSFSRRSSRSDHRATSQRTPF